MKISIFEKINKWVDHAVTKRHDSRHFEKCSVPVGVISQIEHEIVNLTDGVADDETDTDYQEGFYGVSSCQLEFIRLWISTGYIRANSFVEDPNNSTIAENQDEERQEKFHEK